MRELANIDRKANAFIPINQLFHAHHDRFISVFESQKLSRHVNLASPRQFMQQVHVGSNSKVHISPNSSTVRVQWKPNRVWAEVSKRTVNELKKLKYDVTMTKRCEKMKKGSTRSTFSNFIVSLHGPTAIVNSAILGPLPATTLSSSRLKHQRVKNDNKSREDVIFIHGFISSSAFWTETLFPNFSSTAKSTYRFLAVDLLGFGRSPKPADSLYILREHVDMIEKSVLEDYKVKSFHIVAHSLGCILALAIAVKHPGSVKSLTLLTPPYYPVPKGEAATQYVMRKLAPRRVWPVMAFCVSLACWFEHISRTICLVICKNHRLWEFLTKLVTRNRVRTFLMEGFFCHTHNAAWHTLHNIMCGIATKLDLYLDVVRDRLTCDVAIFHGKDDEVIPLECSFNVQRKIPRARVKVVENKDHITIVVARQKAFARELEEIWNASSTSN
ncbi:Detected protein of confused Function [Hibiscus syriacus]|uniref:Detected protein of confused Function n=1 Tax=Hibiscus syriacus TaxID=106335 RepID=A0A6A2X143_HIBSY|nr:Detected protein of confused Function [Hibiscus syriacus]